MDIFLAQLSFQRNCALLVTSYVLVCVYLSAKWISHSNIPFPSVLGRLVIIFCSMLLDDISPGIFYFLFFLFKLFLKYINNSLHLARKYARIFVRGHYLFREANSFPRAKLGGRISLYGIRRPI